MTAIELQHRANTNLATDDAKLSPIRAHIASHGQQYFPELRPEFDIRCSFPYHSTYPIARFELDDGYYRKGIVAKWAPVYRDNNEGLTEFTNYMHFNSTYATRQEARFGCPRALSFLSDQNVLLTEEEPGSTLRYVLCHPLQVHEMPGADLNCALKALGEWLKAFHEIDSAVVPTNSHLQHATPYLSSEFTKRREVLALLGHASLQAIERIRKLVPRALLSQARMGVLHNDYGPGNIVMNRNRVTVLDAAWNKPGLQLCDVAYFITSISLMGALHLRSQNWCELAVRQFIEGYFGDSHLSSEPKLLLVLLRLEALLREAERHMRRIDELPSILAPGLRVFCRRSYAEVIRAAARDAEMA